MTRVDLNGTWELTHRLQPAAGPAAFGETTGPDWETVPADVPGNVELALLAAGKIQDPFVASNINTLRPFEFHEWWYRRSFTGPTLTAGETAQLVFEGLDCVATVWLNGEQVGESANALIEHRFDVTTALKQGKKNELVVRLASPLQAARSRQYEPMHFGALEAWEGIGIRKAPHVYGWDIMPRLVSAGIWRPVSLEVLPPTRITSLAFHTTHANDGHAGIRVSWQFTTDRAEIKGLALRVRGECGESTFETTIDARFVAGATNIGISRPELWWPKGYGEQNLYTVTTDLLMDGKVVDSRTDRIGVRTCELRRTALAGDEGDFRFVVNGTSILIKGSNWVPADAFHSRDASRYDALLALADDIGVNMLRCWGGNVYEDHRFFDLCDEKGILVWQDFSYACCRYPQDEGFLAQVREEAQSVVRKLRNHPSLALWSGDNEIDAMYVGHGLDPAHNRLTREVLPRVVHECDPHRPYLPSSPYMSPEAYAQPNRWASTPEQHLWRRDYFRSRFHTENSAHFVSEIGYHGCPNVSAMKRFLSPEALWPWQDNEEWRVHATDPHPVRGECAYRVELMAKQINEYFDVVPDTLADYVFTSQVYQAEAKKYVVEAYRLRKWRRTGVLWWNLIDGWPQFSDSVVDYYFGKKLAYWYLKRSQQPFCIMAADQDGYAVTIVAGNDSRTEYTGDYTVRDADTGAILASGSFTSPPNENRDLARIPAARGLHALWLIEWTANGRHGANHAVIGEPPFTLNQYRAWLSKIAALDGSFDADEVAE